MKRKPLLLVSLFVSSIILCGTVSAQDDYSVKRGYVGFLEQSNVSVVDEMVTMIAVQRNYDTNQRMITTVDETLEIAVNQLGKL